MTSSTTQFDRPVPQSPLRSWFYAWVDVHGGRSLDEHLLFFKSLYESEYHRSPHPPPFDISIAHGQIICAPTPDFVSYWEKLRDSTGEGGVQFLTALEMREIARDAQELEEKEQELTHRMRELDEAIEQLVERQIAGVLSGQERGESTIARYARKCLRPTLPFPWLLAGRGAAIVFMGLVEVFQLTWPFLDLLGVDTANLSAEWARNPLAVVGGVPLAMAATASLVFLWHLLISWAGELAERWIAAGPLTAGLRLARLFLLSVFLLVGTVAIAALRHGSVEGISALQDAPLGQHDGTRPGSVVFLFLTVLMPAASAYLTHKIGQSAYWQQQRHIQAQQAKFDRDEDQQLLAVERPADAMKLSQSKRARLEEQLAKLRVSRHGLAQRVLSAQREYLEMLDKACQATEVYARTLLASLEQHKIQFLRAAYRGQVPPPPGGDNPPQGPDGPQPPPPFVRPLLTAGRNGDGA